MYFFSILGWFKNSNWVEKTRGKSYWVNDNNKKKIMNMDYNTNKDMNWNTNYITSWSKSLNICYFANLWKFIW